MGFNILLLGHKPDELEEARGILCNDRSVLLVHIVPLDATQASTAALDKWIGLISKLPITILVNNVGGIPDRPPPLRTLDEHTEEGIDSTINLNARFMAQLTRRMIPILARNGPSLMINISSAGQLGMPGLAAYSGAKGLVASLSKAVA